MSSEKRSAEPSVSATDSENFGITVARATISSVDDIEPINLFGRENAAKLLIVRCPTADTRLVHALSRNDFQLMETLVSYRLKLKKALATQPSSGLRVRLALDDEESQIVDLARASFRGAKTHYHVDPRLDRDQCDELYARWVMRNFRDRRQGFHVLAVEEAARLTGFTVIRMNGAKEAESLLAGISPLSAYAKVYPLRSLLIEGMRFTASLGATHAVATTQITNCIVQKVFTRMGGEFSGSLYTFHKWTD